MRRLWIVCAVIVFGASLVYFPAIAVLTATDDGFPLPARVGLVAIDAYLFGFACFVLLTRRGRARLRRGPRKPTDERTVRRLCWFYGGIYAVFLVANVATGYDKRVFALVVLPVFVLTSLIGARLIFRTDQDTARLARWSCTMKAPLPWRRFAVVRAWRSRRQARCVQQRSDGVPDDKQ